MDNTQVASFFILQPGDWPGGAGNAVNDNYYLNSPCTFLEGVLGAIVRNRQRNVDGFLDHVTCLAVVAILFTRCVIPSGNLKS